MKFVAMIATAAVVVGLGQAPHGKGRTKMIELDSRAAGQEVTAHVGDRLAVVLPETGTTGYRWHVTSACLDLLATEFDESRPPTSRPGAAGDHRWVFLAKVAGHCELKFASGRSWEATPGGKVVTFQIVVVPRQ